MSSTTSSLSELSLLTEYSSYDPHRFLGLHENEKGQVIRLWRPGAEKIYLEVLGQVVEAKRVSDKGLFEYQVEKKIGPFDYRIYHHNGSLSHDPYSFAPSIGKVDMHLFNKGCHYELYSVLGAQVKENGTQFSVWAPSAKSVYLVGSFNDWDGRFWPLKSMEASGIWSLFIPGLGAGENYKFEIRTQEGYLRIKSDPVAFYSEQRPLTASRVFDVNSYQWKNESLRNTNLNRPINIYELHLGSWKKGGDPFPNYREIALELATYVKEMGFTHVELLPIMEHPLDESWGYQVTGFFAATSRYGTPADFQFFIDHLHGEGIGVILDWVPAHFPMDDFSLNRFDGTALYEHEDPRRGIHPHWHTAIFNYGRKEVTNFLIASALFWIDKMRVDGLRVDAVASMLYLDYGRKDGEWIPNPDGSNFNVEAIEFLKHLNSIVRERFPGTLMMAEESSSYTGVTHREGLGFDLKWNMGWMNDTLRYFSTDPLYRKYYQNSLTFSVLYAFSEKFMSVLSHDEVVHGKKTMLNKMPGPDWQKFANVRLLYSYMLCQPGKNLLFMGTEVGVWDEWDCKGYIDWSLLSHPLHQGMSTFVKELNHFYLEQGPLWALDFEWQGYEWIDFSDSNQSVISYLRKGNGKSLACVHNFTPQCIFDYWIKLPHLKSIKEVFNTDAISYGGSNKVNSEIEIASEGFKVVLPPLATMIFEVEIG